MACPSGTAGKAFNRIGKAGNAANGGTGGCLADCTCIQPTAIMDNISHRGVKRESDVAGRIRAMALFRPLRSRPRSLSGSPIIANVARGHVIAERLRSVLDRSCQDR